MKKKVFSLLTAFVIFTVCLLPASAYSFGDADMSGSITADDARFALRAAVGLEQLTVTTGNLADVNRDGEVSAEDARLILRACVGLEDFSDLGGFTAEKSEVLGLFNNACAATARYDPGFTFTDNITDASVNYSYFNSATTSVVINSVKIGLGRIQSEVSKSFPYGSGNGLDILSESFTGDESGIIAARAETSGDKTVVTLTFKAASCPKQPALTHSTLASAIANMGMFTYEYLEMTPAEGTVTAEINGRGLLTGLKRTRFYNVRAINAKPSLMEPADFYFRVSVAEEYKDFIMPVEGFDPDSGIPGAFYRAPLPADAGTALEFYAKSLRYADSKCPGFTVSAECLYTPSTNGIITKNLTEGFLSKLFGASSLPRNTVYPRGDSAVTGKLPPYLKLDEQYLDEFAAEEDENGNYTLLFTVAGETDPEEDDMITSLFVAGAVGAEAVREGIRADGSVSGLSLSYHDCSVLAVITPEGKLYSLRTVLNASVTCMTSAGLISRTSGGELTLVYEYTGFDY